MIPENDSDELQAIIQALEQIIGKLDTLGQIPPAAYISMAVDLLKGNHE